MNTLNRRQFMKLITAAAAAGSIPAIYGSRALAGKSAPTGFYDKPMEGDVRILHVTDVHGQLLPVYFREPNVNLGVGDAYGRFPHIVGKEFLQANSFEPGSPEEYAFTYLNFAKHAEQLGRTGGFAYVKTLLDRLRDQAGGSSNTLTVDGGDLWQGSATSLWTRGVDMVEASNILGIDIMVGHWEFTYREDEVLSNVALFKGDFIGQNVRVLEDSLFGDEYPALVERFDGRGLYDEDTGHAFQPYVIKEINGARIAVVGQAFPRTANANPKEFFPDWSFGLREDDMAELVEQIRGDESPDAVVLVSHNGMDVDIKMAERVPGLNAVFGGHTHDGCPLPIKVKNPAGHDCWVTNAGSNGKFVGCMDFKFGDGQLGGLSYQMFPVISDWLDADKEMESFITQMRQTKYSDKIIQSRRKDAFFTPEWVGKTYDEILTERLAKADRLLYRRGNFMGTWDQVICNALRWEYKADIAMSAGVRWGTTTLEGDWITMDDVMSQVATTYSETYVSEMTGEQLMQTLEAVADNLFDPDPYLQSGGDMVRVGGMDYSISPTKGLGERITEARLDNGEWIDPKKTYKVAGWATVNRTPNGRLIWDIIRDYIISTKDSSEVLRIPKINHPKVIGMNNNPGIADYPGKVA
ncbi:MAG: 5'-nucleotidase C-terminal domain-containing protein [Pseudomonadota bacterium]|nr:5'-nucleotidase C-terminal domain-containing protein [Pseudomonadota bacterium]